MTHSDKKLNVIGIIPARGGSKGLPRKNVKAFSGLPLIAWTIKEARESKFIDRLVVSTEDNEIAAVSREYGAEVIKRPKEYALDDSPTIDSVIYTLKSLESVDYYADIVILLQCTSPLRTARHIDEAISIFLDKYDEVDSLMSISEADHPPWWMKKIDSNGYLKDFIEYDKQRYTRRQDFYPVYSVNGSIFISKSQQLYTHRDFDHGRILGYIMDRESSIDIDTEDDFLLAEYLMNKKED